MINARRSIHIHDNSTSKVTVNICVSVFLIFRRFLFSDLTVIWREPNKKTKSIYNQRSRKHATIFVQLIVYFNQIFQKQNDQQQPKIQTKNQEQNEIMNNSKWRIVNWIKIEGKEIENKFYFDLISSNVIVVCLFELTQKQFQIFRSYK